MKRLLLAAILGAALCTAFAEEPTTNPTPDPSALIPQEMLRNISPETLKAGQAAGAAVVRDVLDAYRTKATPENYRFAEETRRRVDTIADEAMEADRAAVMEFLGIDPAADSGLYIFVSWSMPLELLRSYAIEAMWAGGTLVFRGVPPGEEPVKFISEKLRLLVYGKGAAANISIDPRLFDAYQVTAVPTLVFTKVRQDLQCTGVNPTPLALKNGKTATYDRCPELEEDTYWKLTGAVTTNYALQAFIDDGAVTAKPYLTSLARGWANGQKPDKAQRPFTGEWETVPSPSEQLAARQAVQMVTPTTQNTPPAQPLGR